MLIGIGYEEDYFFYVRGNLEMDINNIGEITKIVRFIKLDDNPEFTQWRFSGNAYIDKNDIFIDGLIKRERNLACDNTVGMVKKYALKGKSQGAIGKILRDF